MEEHIIFLYLNSVRTGTTTVIWFLLQQEPQMG